MNALSSNDKYLEKINEDENDRNCEKKCGCFFNWKRFFLPLAIILPILIFFERLQNDFYIFLSCLISSFIISWNFPALSKFGYTKPIYFEDLEQKDNYKKIIKKKIINNIETSKKFQNRFIILQQFILSITLALIIDYSTHRYKNTTLVFTEILGLLGGLFSLYGKITKGIGKVVLNILYWRKKKERKKMIVEMKKNKEYVRKISRIEFNNMMKATIIKKRVRKSSSDPCLYSPKNNGLKKKDSDIEIINIVLDD